LVGAVGESVKRLKPNPEAGLDLMKEMTSQYRHSIE